MPLYLINARDKAGAVDLRMATRSAHLDWASAYKDRMRMGGPVFSADGTTMVGSTFVMAFDTLAEAQKWAADDPYTKAGLFERTEVTLFNWALGTVKPDNG